MKIKIPTSRTITNINLNETIELILVVLFFISTIWARILTHSEQSLLIASRILTIVGIAGLIKLFIKKNGYCIFYTTFLLLCWFFGYAVRLGNNYYDVVDILNSLFFIGLAFLLTSAHKNVNTYRILYYFVALYFFVQIVIRKVALRGLLADGNTYNYISCYIILFFSIYAFALIDKGGKPRYIDSIMLVVTSVFSYGRGGILSVAIYALGYVLIKFYEKRAKLYVYLIAIVAVFVLAVFSDRLISMAMSSIRFAKFSIYGLDSNGRIEIWSSFFNETNSSIINFILGGNPLKVISDGNLHNSFLQMWATMGILFFAVNIVLLIKIIRKRIIDKDWYYLLILITFLARAFTDKMMYRWYGEIIMYFCIFDYFMSETIQRKLN